MKLAGPTTGHRRDWPGRGDECVYLFGCFAGAHCNGRIEAMHVCMSCLFSRHIFLRHKCAMHLRISVISFRSSHFGDGSTDAEGTHEISRAYRVKQVEEGGRGECMHVLGCPFSVCIF